jgi:hypothetical protein
VTFARLTTFLVLALALWACDSPTRPDPRIPEPVGRPDRLSLLPCQYGTATALCPAEARWGTLYSSTLIVTTEARWSSSAPAVVRVVSPGMLQAAAAGDADVTVSYNGADLTERFRVFAGGPPWRVLRGEYHINVVDANGAPLEGVLVEIVAGGNAGRNALSDGAGRAIFVGDIVCGPITVRGSKPGYVDWQGSAILCGRGGNGNWGSETVGPVRLAPQVGAGAP